MRRSLPFAVVVSVPATVLALSFSARPAAAKPSKETAVCIDNFERSQEHRRDQKLLQARTELLLCAASSCPAAIQKPCNAWLSEVAKELPTVVLRVESAEGATLSTATANLDGEASTKALGVPLELDPGQHTVRVRDASGEEASLTVTVQRGEKDKMVVVRLPPKAVEPPPAPPSERAPASSPRRGLTAGPVALFSTSLVAAGVFAFAGSKARSDANELRDRCAPTCPHDQVDAVRTKALVADVALGVGVVTLGLGLWAALSRPTPEKASAAATGAPEGIGVRRWLPVVGIGPGRTTLGTSFSF
jgi:hypothetical protein